MDALETMHLQTSTITVAKTDNAPSVSNEADPTPFLHSSLKLASLVDPESLHSLIRMGGIDTIVNGLGSDRTQGLTVNTPNSRPLGSNLNIFNVSLQDRRAIYGSNSLPKRKSKHLSQFVWLALKDNVLRLLCIAAVISFALGLYSDFGVNHPLVLCPDTGEVSCRKPKVEWVEGVAIMVAIFIVVTVGSVNDWQKDRQFMALNDKKEDRTVKVIRDGIECTVNTKDLVVGDIILIAPGDIIPCDGLFLHGQHVRCDESGVTGEADAVEKITYEQCIQEMVPGTSEPPRNRNYVLISGSKVLEGNGRYIAIAVGPSSFNGRIQMSLQGGCNTSPMQHQINALAEVIVKLGTLAALALFTSLMVKFFVGLANDPDRPRDEFAMDFVHTLVISVTLIVVAVPEGLPLAVTLALAFATKRMTAKNLLVRTLGSCETMANATVICTDKTGTLTQNVMTVVAGSVGVNAKFARQLDEYPQRVNVGYCGPSYPDVTLDMTNLNNVLNQPLKALINQVICINSTASWTKGPVSGEWDFTGSKTETALLRFARELGWDDYQMTRDNAQILQTIPFSSHRKWMGVVVKTSEGRARLLIKGASEVLTAQCDHYVIVNRSGPDDFPIIRTRDIEPEARRNIEHTIVDYSRELLRPIGICYRDLASWPLPDNQTMGGPNGLDASWDDLLQDLTLVSIVAIEDPLRSGVREAVDSCRRAGVAVKICTGDYLGTALSVAKQCGIYTSNPYYMEGPVFRKLSDQEQNRVVPFLHVLARSSPEDKKMLVERLKALGEVVAVTGDGTNDGPALKTAHVGFSMGIAGTDVAKEASDIILLDDNFTSIVSALMWGRCVNDAVRKFLQFQITVNITAVLITFVSAVASVREEPVLTAVQLLWINLIMDAFAALALATDPASPDALDRKPQPKSSSLFTTDMLKQIIVQSLYQTATILSFHFCGDRMLSLNASIKPDIETRRQQAELQTLIFNAFVFCQIFNSLNCRSIDQTKNVFRGLLRNPYLVITTIFEVVIQTLIVSFGGVVFGVTRMSRCSWGVSIGIGFICLPLGFFVRLIPNPLIEKFFIAIRALPDPNALPTTSPESQDWKSDGRSFLESLRWFGRIRGGRIRASGII